MAKKTIPVLMNLDTGAVVIDYEIMKGDDTGLYHIKAKTGTTLLYTEEEMKAKVTAGVKSRKEKKTIVTEDDLVID